MKQDAILVREDGKRFKAIEVNTWTLVTACPLGDPEEDRIKLVAANEYEGFYSKKRYTLTEA